MPLDYTSGTGEDFNEDIENVEQTYTLALDSHTNPDSRTLRYEDLTNFDTTSEDYYTYILDKYPDAWADYYGGSAPAYSEDNAVKLQEAFAFYLYINEDFTESRVADESVEIAPYIESEGTSVGTYENPDAFYNPEVYDRVTNDGADEIPRVQLNGEKIISSRTTDKPHLADIYSAEQLASTEYETTRNGPKSMHDWGGPYATGGNTY